MSVGGGERGSDRGDKGEERGRPGPAWLAQWPAGPRFSRGASFSFFYLFSVLF